MNPVSWKVMVETTRELERALGDGIKRVEENEKYCGNTKTLYSRLPNFTKR